MVIGLISNIEKQKGVPRTPFFNHNKQEVIQTRSNFGVGLKGKIVSRNGILAVQVETKRKWKQIPKGFKKVIGATTAPRGFELFSNRTGSRFVKKDKPTKFILVKKRRWTMGKRTNRQILRKAIRSGVKITKAKKAIRKILGAK